MVKRIHWKYELPSKLQKVLDTEYSITEPAVKVKEEVVSQQNEGEAKEVNNSKSKVEVSKAEIDDGSKIKPVYVAVVIFCVPFHQALSWWFSENPQRSSSSVKKNNCRCHGQLRSHDNLQDQEGWLLQLAY